MWLYLSLLLLPSLANKYFSNLTIILRSVGEHTPTMLTRVPTSTLLLKISLSSSGKLTSVAHIPTQPPYPTEVCFVFSRLAHLLPVQSQPAVMWQQVWRKSFKIWGVSANFFKCECNLQWIKFKWLPTSDTVVSFMGLIVMFIFKRWLSGWKCGLI